VSSPQARRVGRLNGQTFCFGVLHAVWRLGHALEPLGAQVEPAYLGVTGGVGGMLLDDGDLAHRIASRLAQPCSDRLERRDELVAGTPEEVADVILIHRPAA